MFTLSKFKYSNYSMVIYGYIVSVRN